MAKHYVTMTHSVVTAASDSGTLLTANSNRRYALIINNGSQPIFLMFDTAASTSQGIPIAASGAYEMSTAYDNLTSGSIFVISASLGDILVVEGS